MSMSTAKWLTDQPNQIQFAIYESPSTVTQKLTSVKTQEIPHTQSWEKEATLTNAVNKYTPLKMPVTPTSKTKTAATPSVMSRSTREDTPWPNTFPASANQFVVRSWPVPPATESTTTARPEVRNALQPSLPHPAHLNPGSQAPVPNTQEQLCRWGLCCSICIQSAPKPETESDWNGEIAREKDR